MSMYFYLFIMIGKYMFYTKHHLPSKKISVISFVSSEGALIAITPYDYPQQRRPLFKHTPVLENNLNINAMMTLVTMITIKTEIAKTTSEHQQHQQH